VSQDASARVPLARTFTASQDVCPEDGSRLWIVQHRRRIVHGLDESIAATFRDTRCMREDCPLHDRRYRPAEESMLVLPKMSFGLDVVTAVGSMRMREDASFPKIHARLVERGVPIAPMTVQYVLRYYLALTSCVAGRVDQKLLSTAAQKSVSITPRSLRPRTRPASSLPTPSPSPPTSCSS